MARRGVLLIVFACGFVVAALLASTPIEVRIPALCCGLVGPGVEVSGTPESSWSSADKPHGRVARWLRPAHLGGGPDA